MHIPRSRRALFAMGAAGGAGHRGRDRLRFRQRDARADTDPVAVALADPVAKSVTDPVADAITQPDPDAHADSGARGALPDERRDGRRGQGWPTACR